MRVIDNGVQYQWLPGGQGQARRLHLQHGPIDLVIEANGDRQQVSQAYQQAFDAANGVLNGLVACLSQLRTPLKPDVQNAFVESCDCPVARRMMMTAVRFHTHDVTATDRVPASTVDTDTPAYADSAWMPDVVDADCQHKVLPFITPMICVAGAVADHVLQAMLAGTDLQRAYVNNGGDIALWLSAQSAFTVGICNNVQTAEIASHITLRARHAVQGIATSGWRGRSHSLGIADAVTVLADSAATADAAATLVANAIDLPDCARIHRQPASELSPDSDLGDMPVTVAVDSLSQQQVDTALDRGKHLADRLIESGRIYACYMSLANTVSVCSVPQLSRPGLAISG